MKKTLALLLLLAGLTVEAQGRTLYWTGDYSIYWNHLESHINWKDEDGNDTFYQEGDDVVFHNCDNMNVEVWGVSPGSMLVDNSAGKLYTFDRDVSGGGSIDGNMNLTKRGEGNLTIECACNYTGDTFIYGGTTCIEDERPRVFGDKEPAWLGHGDIFLCGGRLRLFSSQPYANNIYVKGEATLDCRDHGGSLTVQNTGKLTLDAALHSSGGNLILQDGAMVNVGGYAVSFYGATGTEGLIKVDGNATLGNGEIRNCMLNVAAGKTLTLLENTTATFGTNFNLGEGATLDLGGNSVNFVDASISASGNSASIGNGKITGDLTVAEGKQITLLAGTTITGGVTLGDNASLDLGKNAISGAVTVAGSATIGNGTVEGGLTVAENKSLALLADTTITGDVSLEDGATFNLGGGSLSSNVSLGWDTTIGGGTLNGEISFAVENQQLSLCGDLGGTGDIAIGVVNKNSSSPIGIDLPHPVFTSTLDMGGHTLTKGLKLDGDTTVSNGRLVLAHDMTRSLDDIQARTVTIGAVTTVDLNEHTFSHNLAVEADTAIGNGTIGGKVTVDDGKSVRFFGETKIDSNNKVGDDFLAYKGLVEAGKTKIQALHRPLESQIGAPVYPGLLQELSVSDGLIAGTDRQSSLAAGLEIESTANLMIKSMTITADNKISVGQNTITLNDVTIKLSQTSYDIVDGVYYFTLSDLFHCSVDMTDVTFDASGLTLPEGFNPETNGISFNLGDAKLTAETADRDIYLLMGAYGSRTLSIDNQGRPVFTALVPTPEPTTGTLGLLALAALAARRRK